MSNYIVKPGESITDVVLNSTGTLVNWDAILTANGFTDWTPILAAGQAIIIPSTVQIDINALKQLQQYPLCNNINQILLNQLITIFNYLSDLWILSTGFWNDNSIWKDNKFWID